MVLVTGTYFLTYFGEKYAKNGQAGKSGNVLKEMGFETFYSFDRFSG